MLIKHVVKVIFKIKWNNVDSTKIPWIKHVLLNIIELLIKENTIYFVLKPKSTNVGWKFSRKLINKAMLA